ncbi:unnamed protein product [Acanthoscelides obtectus]|uniref:Uncharacterized protein n=1 Tax=Acanthoscelides obtectus TaxID=200917 RepID=A0A9P0Q3B4_ACAOB|nr:unnamed protein product [Acanthoscelides obtectus]CAK1685731.1 Circadian clock-controlled protein [Acanthoscelides obtectus]
MNCVWMILLCACFVTVQSDKFPGSIKRCHLKDSNLDDCLTEGIQKTYELLGKGPINAISLVGIEPILIDKVVIGAGTSAVHLDQHYENVKLHGFSKSKVSKVHMDWAKKTLEYETLSPLVTQKADYDLNGKIMVFPVYGKGESTIKLSDVTMEHAVKFKEETKGGKKYLIVDSYTLKININGAHYDFQNLFDGDKLLADNILTVINENWKEVFDDVRSGIEGAYSEVCKHIANGLFTHIPYNEIFLE